MEKAEAQARATAAGCSGSGNGTLPLLLKNFTPESGNESKDKEQSQFMQLPDLAISNILKYLPKEDFLRLRLTSKTTNQWATEFMCKKRRFDKDINLEIEQLEFDIDGGERKSGLLTFGEFLQGEYLFNVRSLWLKNYDEEIFKDPYINEFLQLFGAGIEELTLDNFSVISTAQKQFFAQLKNLACLTINNIDMYQCKIRKYKPKHIQTLIPKAIMKNIQYLSLGKIYGYSLFTTNFHEVFLEQFPNLVCLKYPELIYDRQSQGIKSEWKFDFLKKLVRTQCQSHPFAVSNLLTIDLENLKDYENDLKYCSEDFISLVMFLYNGGDHPAEVQRLPGDGDRFLPVKIENVDIRLMDHIGAAYPNDPEYEEIHGLTQAFDNIIGSIKNASHNLWFMRMWDITSFDITVSTSINHVHPHPIQPTFWNYLHVHFNELMKLRFNFDIPLDRKDVETFNKFKLMRDFFLERRYAEITTLILEFGEAYLESKLSPKIFCVRTLLGNFLNVHKLEIINWNPCNKSFIVLWEAFAIFGNLSGYMLDELILKDCPSLGNTGFIGTNENDPIFLQLKGLKKLTLKVDKMKKLTDRAFKDVFRHMSLTEFNLISEQPMDKITRSGIEWLLEGKFVESIIKFPFTTWTCTTIPPEEMLLLKSQFKSLVY